MKTQRPSRECKTIKPRLSKTNRYAESRNSTMRRVQHRKRRKRAKKNNTQKSIWTERSGNMRCTTIRSKSKARFKNSAKMSSKS